MYNWRNAEVIAWNHMDRKMLLEIVTDIVDVVHARWKQLEEPPLAKAYREEHREGETVQEYIDRIMEPHVEGMKSLLRGDDRPDHVVGELAEEVSPAEDQEEARAEAEETEEELDEGLPPGRGGLPAGEFLLKALSGFLLSVLVGAGFAALFLR